MGYDPNRENNGINALIGKPIMLVNKSTENILKDAEAARLQNELLKQWAPKVRTALKGSAARFNDGKTKSFVMRHNGDQREGKLANSINAQYKELYGETYGVSFKFERHGVFVQKGVGRGYKIPTKGGSVVRTNKEPAIGRERVAVDWFNPIIEQYLPELANRLAEIRADAVLNVGKMLIK